MRQILLLVLSFCLAGMIEGTVFYNKTGDGVFNEIESVTVHYYSAEINDFLNEFNETAVMVIVDSVDTDVNISGKIVLTDFTFGVDDVALAFKKKGAVGIVMSDTPIQIRGRASYLLSQPRRELYFPTVQISREDYWVLSEFNGSVVTIVSEPDEENPFTETMIFISWFSPFFLGIPASAIVILCFFLIGLDIAYHSEFKVSIKMVLLITILAMHIVVLTYSVSDVFGSSRHIGWSISAYFMLVFDLPVKIICVLLLSLYWMEILSDNLKQDQILGKTKTPFTIICVVFASLSLLLLIVSSVAPSSVVPIIYLLEGIIGIFWTSLSIFHIVSAFGIAAKLRRSKRRDKKTKKFLVKVMIISSFDLLAIFIRILVIWIPVFRTPFLSVFSYILVIFLIEMSSMSILFLFEWNLNEFMSTFSNHSQRSTATAGLSTEQNSRLDIT